MIIAHDTNPSATTNPVRNITLGDIEKLSAEFEAESAGLEEKIAELEADLEAVRAKHLRGLKRKASAVANHEAELRSAVESAPHLFIKPRTITIHGIKSGFTTSNGKVIWDDDDTVIAKIRKLRKEEAGTLIRTKEEPNKDALRNLSTDELKALGVRIEGAGDVVTVKRVAGDVEKLIEKLMSKLVEAMVEQPD